VIGDDERQDTSLDAAIRTVAQNPATRAQWNLIAEKRLC
jgi:hypothetical protein